MKRWLALLLALVITLSCVPVSPAHAHETEELTQLAAPEETLPVEVVEEETEPLSVCVPGKPDTAICNLGIDDNDDLFADYVNSIFYPQQAQVQSTHARDRLPHDLQLIYDGISWLFTEIANGKRTDASISIGVDGEYAAAFTGTEPDDADVSLLMDAFLSDLAYEQYWFDKVSGLLYGFNVSGDNLETAYFMFYVAENYQGEDEFHTDSSVTGAAIKSAANARQIVADNASGTDYEKLSAYCKTICQLTDYNHTAADKGNFSENNDPWQLIHVFDGISSTKVVCEGYSKAFKYLCDQSDFSDPAIACYLVTGNCGGAHMWNVVSIGGKNYLTDVTNVDTGWDLFLPGASGSVTGTYKAGGLSYSYDSYTKGLWGTGSDSILKLSSTAYTPDTSHTHTPGAVATCTEPQICTSCGATLQSALGHAPGAAATCTAPQTCTRCSAELSPALGHTYENNACIRCGATQTQPDEEGWPFEDWEWEVLALTNKERFQEGLPPLTGFGKIQAATGVRAEELVELFDHTRPDGTICFTALDEAGVPYWAAAENIAAGYKSPAAVVEGWMNSPGHRANILHSEIQHIGIGYHYDASAYYRYHWAQLFVSDYKEENTAFTLVCPQGTDVKVGTPIEDMGIYAKVENSTYGTCYLPITSEFCSGYDPDSNVNQTVTVSVLGFTATFDVTFGAHTHSFGKWYQTQAPTCTEAGQERRDCSTCNIFETREVAPLGHKPGKAATCTTAQFCTVCNAEVAPALGHSTQGEPTCDTGVNCSRCGELVLYPMGHLGGPEPTCTDPQACVRCGYEIYPALGHNEISVPGRAPTCTWPGYSDSSYCDRCSQMLIPQETIPAKGHTPHIPAPTCTESQVCVDCFIELAPPTGHTPGAAPTCTEAQLCTVCQAELAPATGHTPGAAPTCTEAQACAVCGEVLAAPLGHDPVTVPGTPPTCTKGGLSDGSHCGRCGEVLTPQTELPAAGHKPGPEPTADAPQTCTVCGEVLKAKLPHIQDCSFALVERMVYTGQALTPDVTITTPAGDLLAEGSDYTLSYKNNTSIGKAAITVTGLGKYGGQTTLHFNIVPDKVQNLRLNSVSSTSVKIAYNKVPGAARYNIYVDGVYKGSTTSTTYTVQKLKPGTTYRITVEAAKEVNKVLYLGLPSDELTVKPGTSLSKCKASLSYTSTVYDGSEKCPVPTLKTSSKKKLVLGTDYTVTYENNLQIGKATVTFVGIGKYAGSITKTFTILPGKVTGVACTVTDPTTLAIRFDAVPGAQYYKVYVGGKLKATVTEPACTLTGLKTGTTYKITVKAGAMAADQEYLGSASASVSAKPTYDLTKCGASLAYETTAYTGKSKSPSVTVLKPEGGKLKKDTHYTVKYSANKSVGLATVTITGKGTYGGTITRNFAIVPGKVSSLSISAITGDSAKVTWKKVSGAGWYRIFLDGEAVESCTSTAYTLTGLEAGKTYQVTVLAGKTVGGTEYVSESVSKTLTPTWDLRKFTLRLESDKLTYTGDAVIPALTVTDATGSSLTAGTDFTVTCKNNTKVGKATVTVTGTGKYRGSITKSFQIVPGKVQNVTAVTVNKTSVKISYDKVQGASTYYIYVNGKLKGSTSSASYTVSKLKAGTTYEITVVAGKKVSSTTYKGAPSDVLMITTTG